MKITIFAAVRQLRKAYGETQQAFSNRLGMSIGSIANYEGGQRYPDGPSVIKLARAAGAIGRLDLVDVFQEVICDYVGCLVVPVENADEYRKVQDFLRKGRSKDGRRITPNA
jgi:transcriptional regulator with XRE-family HTH domain